MRKQFYQWIARSTIDMPWRNFLSPEFRTSSRGSIFIVVDNLNFPKKQYRIGWKKAFMRKKQINRSFILMEHRLVTDRETDRQTDRHRATVSTRASIASSGQNVYVHGRPHIGEMRSADPLKKWIKNSKAKTRKKEQFSMSMLYFESNRGRQV